MQPNLDARPSPIAGRWYPGRADQLAREVDAHLAAAADPGPGGLPIALVAPHAGLPYSGPVAAHAFRALAGRSLDVAAILCPSHFHADGAVLTSGHAAYETPLGVVPVDRAAIDRLRIELAGLLAAPPEQTLVAIRHDREHAIEMELPFLQRTLAPGFGLLPIMVRDQSGGVARALGQALARVLAGRRALLIASTDLSHFYPQAVAQQLDAEMLRQIEAFDPAGVLQAEADGRGLACGHGGVAAVLWAARALGATRVHVVRHATSGDVTGDFSQVVGYGAAIIWKD